MPVLINQVTGDQVFLDVIDVEATELPGEATRHPVEGFDNVIDHVITQPVELELTCSITHQPFSDEGFPLQGVGTGNRRSKRVVRALKQWKENAEMVNYISLKLGLYANLLIENVSLSYGQNKDEFLDIVISLVQVQKGQSQRVELPPIRPAGQKEIKECGPRTGEEIVEEEEEDGSIRRITFGARLLGGGDDSETAGKNLKNAVSERQPGASLGGGYTI